MNSTSPARTFADGDLVDVTIIGAIVVTAGPNELTYHLPGREFDLQQVPTADDDGHSLPHVTVTHHVPDVQPGEVWRAARTGALYWATDPTYQAVIPTSTGEPMLVDVYGRQCTVAQVVTTLGPIELLMAYPGHSHRPAVVHPPVPAPDTGPYYITLDDADDADVFTAVPAGPDGSQL